MADRSPKFPSVSLPEAIDLIRLVYSREGRSRMPRLSAVKPLGYSSINGRSLTVLGALRAYGLLEGRGDEVRVSDDAITILNAPQESSERMEALSRAFEAPPSFALLRSKGDASPDTLRWHLIKANFRDEAADKLLQVYLESRDFVNSRVGESVPTEPPEEPQRSGFNPSIDEMANQLMPFPAPTKPQAEQSPRQPVPERGRERVLQSGMLSKAATYSVIVSGPVGVAEIERLIKKLEMDKEILADTEPTEDAPQGGYSDHSSDGWGS